MGPSDPMIIRGRTLPDIGTKLYDKMCVCVCVYKEESARISLRIDSNGTLGMVF